RRPRPGLAVASWPGRPTEKPEPAPGATSVADGDARSGEARAQLAHLTGGPRRERTVVGGGDDARHPRGDVLHLRLLHAARGDRGRADADPRRIEGLAR